MHLLYIPDIEYFFSLEQNFVTMKSTNVKLDFFSTITKYGILTDKNFFTLDTDNNLMVYDIDIFNGTLSNPLKLNQRFYYNINDLQQ